MAGDVAAGETPRQGLLDTNILILRRGIAEQSLPEEMAISAVSLAELSAGVHLVDGDDVAARAERARRIEVLQRIEHEFEPIPFDADAARLFGRINAAVLAAGRTPRRRVADLMIAAVAAANDLPLFTTNPDDFVGLGEIVEVVDVPRPR
ncbi:type II toxin-antitoxin system VapC family toxin [Nocardioides stalactiti]|uniref:type II toxin-antitoxin system VapC family toxin n=1 Tax=Nocardioides stalactiti TaxID=2755356 RepID=UPI001601C503|nr:type II toxin-antitoxin system VapC family toxin [Nocardioides stalactiti]